ncbi:MAG: polysaccharide biosynthesis tyrosine autokinase, partial [Desulfohalobiaceae bacterium]
MQQSEDHTENQPTLSSPELPQEDEIDLRDLLTVLWSGKWVICGVALLCLLLGIGYAIIQPPVYKADALIQADKERSPLTGLEEMRSAMGQSSSTVQPHIQLLKSRSVLGQVVDKQNLRIQAQPMYFPVFGEALARLTKPHPEPAAPLLGLESYAWGGERIQVERLKLPSMLRGEPLFLRAGEENSFVLKGPEGEPILQGNTGRVESTEYGGAEIAIFVSRFEARPGTWFQVAKKSSLSCIEGLRSRLSVNEEGEDTGIINLGLTGREPSQAETILKTLTSVYLRQNVEQRTAQAEERLKFLNQQLPQLQEEMESAEERLSEFQQKNTVIGLNEEAKSMLDRMVELENQLTRLGLKESELERKYNSKHPMVQSLQDKKRQLQEQKTTLQSSMKRLPKTQRRLLELKRKVKVHTDLYTSLLNKAQEIKLLKAGELGDVRIVDSAVASTSPVEPNRRMIAALSLILGLFLGTGAVFLRRALNPTIHDPEGLESRLGYPVYAVLPHSSQESRLQRRAKRRKAPLPVLSMEAPNDSAVESMRSLRTSLQFALSGSESKCLVFTGASPSVGKTFVAINMAHLLAQAGQKVLLVDCDMRKGTLHRYLGKDRSPGLSEYLAGSKEIQDILHPAAGEGPECIFSGTLPPNPAELLMGQRLTDLLQWARERYDQVILETTPVMAAADASIVAAHAGPVFFVVRAGMNTEQEVGQSIKRLQQNRVRVAGFVFNDLGGRQSDKSYTSR